MKQFVGMASLLFLLVFLHVLPLLNPSEYVAGGVGDPLAHAGIGEWYCKNVVTGHYHSDIYLSPYGTDFSGSFDSPFPFILTCPFVSQGPLVQFHLFTILQILLIVISSLLVARLFLSSASLQFCYVLFVWWCGYYVVRTHAHETLLSNIWGFQGVLYAVSVVRVSNWKSVLKSSVIVSLCFAGTFQNFPSLFLMLCILLLMRMWEQGPTFSRRTIVANFVLAAVIFLALTGIFWGPMIEFTLEHKPVNLDGFRVGNNFDLLSPFIPYDLNIMRKWWTWPEIGFERTGAFDLLVLFVSIYAISRKKFWQDRQRIGIFVVAASYFVLSLGSQLRFGNRVLAPLDFNTWIFHILPFSLTRTPARLALVTSMCLTFLAFLYLDELESKNFKKYGPSLLILWIFVTGPLMNNMIFFPHLSFREILPMRGLESMRKLPEDSIVLNIPAAWQSDPSQNFLRLFHHQKISAGYVAYTAYTQDLTLKFRIDPFLGRLGCRGEPLAYSETDFMKNNQGLENEFKKRNYRGFIINRDFLEKHEECDGLRGWVQEFLKSSWIQVTEDNGHYVTGEVR